jgi:ABC-type amino acid transport substrate-binding protein
MKNYLCCLMLGCSLAVFAEPSAPTNAPLRVGISPVFPPMAFKQGKELAGVEVDLARALGEHLGRKVVFVELPWRDQIEALNDGKTDIIMSSMSITHARRYVVNFTQPYFVVGQMALVRREDKIKYAMGFPYSLPGKPGVLRATTGEFLVQRDFPKSKRTVYDTGAQAATALQKGKIDLFVSDSTLICYLAGLHAADGLSVVPLVLSEEPLAWAVRKSDDPLLAAANGFISQASRDGTLQKVFRRWTATNE